MQLSSSGSLQQANNFFGFLLSSFQTSSTLRTPHSGLETLSPPLAVFHLTIFFSQLLPLQFLLAEEDLTKAWQDFFIFLSLWMQVLWHIFQCKGTPSSCQTSHSLFSFKFFFFFLWRIIYFFWACSLWILSSLGNYLRFFPSILLHLENSAIIVSTVQDSVPSYCQANTVVPI